MEQPSCASPLSLRLCKNLRAPCGTEPAQEDQGRRHRHTNHLGKCGASDEEEFLLCCTAVPVDSICCARSRNVLQRTRQSPKQSLPPFQCQDLVDQSREPDRRKEQRRRRNGRDRVE